MGCRPAKLSKVDVITDSVSKCQNGNKVFIQKGDTTLSNGNSNQNKPDILEINKNTENTDTLPTSNRREASKIAWREQSKSTHPTRTISPVFKSVPPIVTERSQSQIDFFEKLDARMNKGLISLENNDDQDNNPFAIQSI